MNIKYIHEYAYFKRIAVGIGIAYLFNRNNTPIGRRQHIKLALGRKTRWVAKKLQHKHGQQPENDRGGARPESDKNRHQHDAGQKRSEEHTSELQSLMRTSYAVFCLNKKQTRRHRH